MGWKNVKEHYRIAHIVCVTKEGLCIGSPYIHNIIVVAPDGTLKKRDTSRVNDDLARYQREMEADPAKVRQLMDSPDTFGPSVAVYTYDGGEIIEKQCEETGWPNVTHDGELMYENTFSTDKATVLKWAKRNAEAGIEIWTGNLKEARKRVEKCESELAQATRELAKLEADFPTASAALP